MSSILHLHGTIGNQAVRRLLPGHAKELEPASPVTPSAGSLSGFPAGIYEHEADRVADSVAARVTPSATANPAGQRGADFSGQLAPALRTKLEDALGWSLGHVRIHTDKAAGEEARTFGARAFTRGNDIFFGPGTFKPHTQAGISLLGHELAHVIQHGSGRVPPATVQKKDDWNFTPADYQDLVKKKSDLKFGPDSAWFPRALKDNLLMTVKFALTSTKPVRTAGISVDDFYHGHVTVPRSRMTQALRDKVSDFETNSKSIQGKALGGDWVNSVTPENLAAFIKAMQDTEKLATPMLEEALKTKGAAVFYHTFESNGSSMKAGSPIRNIMTPVGGIPRSYDPSGVEKGAEQFRTNNFEILQFAFLVDETGVIHVTTGGTFNLPRVTGRLMW